MITLEINQYNLIKHMFSEIPGCPWHLAVMEEKKLGKIVIDKLPSPQTAYIETPYLFYYFGGTFDKSFLNSMIKHILSDLIPYNETSPIFVFSSSQQWKDEIEKCLQPYNSSTLGAYLYRRLLHLNLASYENARKMLKPLPKEYTIEVRNQHGEVAVIALYNDIEACTCHNGGQGLGFMDFDVFTHPNHRNRGLAQICCYILIDYCIEHDIIPQWGCWTINIPSCNLAEKLGFKITAETQVNFAEINMAIYRDIKL